MDMGTALPFAFEVFISIHVGETLHREPVTSILTEMTNAELIWARPSSHVLTDGETDHRRCWEGPPGLGRQPQQLAGSCASSWLVGGLSGVSHKRERSQPCKAMSHL